MRNRYYAFRSARAWEAATEEQRAGVWAALERAARMDGPGPWRRVEEHFDTVGIDGDHHQMIRLILVAA